MMYVCKMIYIYVMYMYRSMMLKMYIYNLEGVSYVLVWLWGLFDVLYDEIKCNIKIIILKLRGCMFIFGISFFI